MAGGILGCVAPLLWFRSPHIASEGRRNPGLSSAAKDLAEVGQRRLEALALKIQSCGQGQAHGARRLTVVCLPFGIGKRSSEQSRQACREIRHGLSGQGNQSRFAWFPQHDNVIRKLPFGCCDPFQGTWPMHRPPFRSGARLFWRRSMRTLITCIMATSMLAGCASYGGDDRVRTDWRVYDYNRPDPSYGGYYADRYYREDARRYRERVRRQNIRHNSRRRLAECGPRLGFGFRRRACGVASADARWSVA
jgi:hypothetical protein